MSMLVFTAYRRTGYFEQTVNSWKKVRGIADIPVHVFLEPSENQDRMIELAQELGAEVHLNRQRYGVLVNPFQALDFAFTASGAPFAILAEDDVVVGADVLEYFEWAANRFGDDQDVLAVCAFSATPGAGVAQAVLRPRFSPLVWGTWADRWQGSLRPTWDFTYSSGKADGTPSGWDWNINLRVAAGRQFVTPVCSRSDHIGEFDGTHMIPQDFPASRAAKFVRDVVPVNFYLDR